MVEEPAAPAEAPAPTPPAEKVPPAEPAPVAEEWETRFKYLLADFENFRRRTSRDQERVRLRARGELLRTLLPFFEAIDRAREAVRRSPETDPVRRGVELLGSEAEAFLAAEKVEPLAQPGMPFRADDHEAVAEAPVSAAHAEGTVVEVVQQGYSYPGGILRPAKVVVARRPVNARPASSGTEPSDPTSSE
jgi:molecular chaperone GrpE